MLSTGSMEKSGFSVIDSEELFRINGGETGRKDYYGNGYVVYDSNNNIVEAVNSEGKDITAELSEDGKCLGKPDRTESIELNPVPTPAPAPTQTSAPSSAPSSESFSGPSGSGSSGK